jgi:hypothetical protein
VLRKIMLLAAVVTLVLSAGATALAGSQSGNDSGPPKRRGRRSKAMQRLIDRWAA